MSEPKDPGHDTGTAPPKWYEVRIVKTCTFAVKVSGVGIDENDIAEFVTDRADCSYGEIDGLMTTVKEITGEESVERLIRFSDETMEMD